MEQLADVAVGPPPKRRSGATAGSPTSISTGSVRFPPSSSVEPGDEAAPGGGPVAAEAGERSGLVVVRNGRVVHHSLDDDLVAKGVQVCGLATCEQADVEDVLGVCSDASPDAFTVLHDAFLAGGAVVKVPAGVVVAEADRGAALVGGRRPRQLPAHARRRGRERRGHGVRPLRLDAHALRRTSPATSSTRSSS